MPHRPWASVVRVYLRFLGKLFTDVSFCEGDKMWSEQRAETAFGILQRGHFPQSALIVVFRKTSLIPPPPKIVLIIFVLL